MVDDPSVNNCKYVTWTWTTRGTKLASFQSNGTGLPHREPSQGTTRCITDDPTESFCAGFHPDAARPRIRHAAGESRGVCQRPRHRSRGRENHGSQGRSHTGDRAIGTADCEGREKGGL